MKGIAHLLVGLVFSFLLTALTFDIPSRASQGVVKTQAGRVADAESRIEWWRERALACPAGAVVDVSSKTSRQDSSNITIRPD